MANIKQTTLNQYKTYWKLYIQPIKEDKIQTQFEGILAEVGQRLHGVEFSLSLLLFFIQEGNTAEILTGSISDNTINKTKQ